jgi:3-deoxy-D-arabino-heptulosonate 7-phosphate (DAHP) synthase class II
MSNLKFEATDRVLNELRVFTPSQQVIDNANIMSYMKSKGYTDYHEFHKWSVENRN